LDVDDDVSTTAFDVEDLKNILAELKS
jgi:hypothetical protein